MAKRLPVEERLKRNMKIDENGCWIWQGSKSGSGYPMIQMGRGPGEGPKLAHRISYKVFNGEIPEGMVIDHLCYKEGGYSNRLCINPEHLEVTSHSDNLKRGWKTKKAEGWKHYKTIAFEAGNDSEVE